MSILYPKVKSDQLEIDVQFKAQNNFIAVIEVSEIRLTMGHVYCKLMC